MNASGQFVVAWTLEFSPTDTDVHAALFNANGTFRAADFGVATTWKREFDASAGIAADGSFVISYTLQFGSGDQDVHAAMFDAGAHELRDIGVATSTQVENNSHVAMNPNGNFAVSYLVNGGSTVKFFSADGQLSGSQVTAQGHKNPGQPHTPPPKPKPAMDGTLAGGYVVGANNRAAGIRYDLAGIGTLAGLGETFFSGELRSTALVRSGHASGVLTWRATTVASGWPWKACRRKGLSRRCRTSSTSPSRRAPGATATCMPAAPSSCTCRRPATHLL
jgi:hypothetical protein